MRTGTFVGPAMFYGGSTDVEQVTRSETVGLVRLFNTYPVGLIITLSCSNYIPCLTGEFITQ